jgi:predicted Rossmann fold flavoprotein
MFPATDLSQTIMDCLTEAARGANVKVRCQSLIASIQKSADGRFSLQMESGETLEADRLILATGGNPQGWEWASHLGHTIEPPVPSLFTFTIQDPRLEGLSGVAVPRTVLRLEPGGMTQEGALLITHWGLSGPAVLKLSAWGARVLHEAGYQARLRVNWLPEFRGDELLHRLVDLRNRQILKKAPGDYSFGLPRRLWVRLAATSGILANKRWTEVSNENLKRLAVELQAGVYSISGRSVFKEEFVTCGGVRLDEVDFRTMESKRCPQLYFAGEVLDIDGVTGGFNFQSAWTTGWLAGRSAAGQAA